MRAVRVLSRLLFLSRIRYFLSSVFFHDGCSLCERIQHSFFFHCAGAFSEKAPLNYVWGAFLRRVAFFTRQIAIAIPAAYCFMCFLRHPTGPGDIFYPPLILFTVFRLMPILIAQIFGVTICSLHCWTTWVIDYWLHHYNQAVPGILRILMHSGLALLPLSMPLIASVYRRPLFWGVDRCFTYFDGLLDIVCGRNSQSARRDVAVEYPRQRASPLTGPTSS